MVFNDQASPTHSQHKPRSLCNPALQALRPTAPAHLRHQRPTELAGSPNPNLTFFGAQADDTTAASTTDPTDEQPVKNHRPQALALAQVNCVRSQVPLELSSPSTTLCTTLTTVCTNHNTYLPPRKRNVVDVCSSEHSLRAAHSLRVREPSEPREHCSPQPPTTKAAGCDLSHGRTHDP